MATVLVKVRYGQVMFNHVRYPVGSTFELPSDKVAMLMAEGIIEVLDKPNEKKMVPDQDIRTAPVINDKYTVDAADKSGKSQEMTDKVTPSIKLVSKPLPAQPALQANKSKNNKK